MTEKPILFDGEMVRAILDGRKTQTRRIVKLPIIRNDLKLLDIVKHGDEWLMKVEDENLFVAHLGDDTLRIKCPYGVTGDRLWVRESWRVGAWNCDNDSIAIDYRADSLAKTEWLYLQDSEEFERLWQQSCDDSKKSLGYRDEYKWKPGESPCRWRPSTHMPRWASRITLEVTGVRVERLQEISEDDARAEGMLSRGGWNADETKYGINYTGPFSIVWDSINAKRPGCSWEDNPWVFVVEFKRV